MIEQTIAAKLLAWLATLVPAIIGAAISLRLAQQQSSFASRILAFACGVALAHYIGGAVVDHFNIDRTTMIDDSIILAAGIFGMATVTEINTQLPEIIRAASDKVKSWFNK